MKIVHITEAFGGGVFTILVDVINKMVEAGHDVHLVYSKRPQTPQNYQDYFADSVNLHELPMKSAISLKEDWRSAQKLKQLVNDINPDIIHLHSSKAGAIGRWAMGNGQYPLFYTPHGLAFLRKDVPQIKQWSFKAFEMVLHSFFGGEIIACSKGEEKAMKNILPLRRNKVLTVENAVPQKLITVKKWPHQPQKRLKIGTLGRISYQKNPTLFIAIAKDLKVNYDFIWIGGGEELQETKMREVGINVTGWCEREKGLQHLADLDIYIQTSLWEGMPVAIIEAMLTGLPVIANDVIGNRDVLNIGQTGFIAKSKSDFVESIQNLSNNKTLRQKVGQEAREVAKQRFSLDRMVKELLEVYSSALS